MFETHLTVVGRIVTDLRRKPVNGQELISFRVASNSRRRNGDGIWEPGNSLFIPPAVDQQPVGRDGGPAVEDRS